MKSFLLVLFSTFLICNELIASGVNFTDQEKQWIKDNQVKVGMYPFYPPYAFIVDDQSIIGLFPDLRALIKEYSGLRFKQVFYPNWEAYLEAAETGEIDMILPIIPTEKRKAFLNFSKPIVMDPHAIVIRNNDRENISYENLKDNNDLVIAAVRGYFITDYVKRQFPSHEIRYYADDRQCINALLDEMADIFVTQTYTASFFIRENERLSVISDIPTNTILAIGTSKENPILNQIINKTLEKLPESSIPDLINYWTYGQYQPVYKKLLFLMILGLGALILAILLFTMNKILQVRVKSRTYELMKAKLKAEESEKLKTAFVLNISHEIRTPLNAINGFSELLSLQFEDESIKAYSRDIIANSHRLTTVVESMIIFAQLESGKLEIQKRKVPVCGIIESTALKYKEMYPEKLDNVEFETECAASSLSIETDAYYFRKMLGFILDNAFKFTTQGRIRFGYRFYHGELTIFIEDTGVGIKRETLPKIFDRFYKFSVEDDKFHAGTGVGLTVANILSEVLGFKLDIDSEPDHGTVVTFSMSIKD